MIDQMLEAVAVFHLTRQSETKMPLVLYRVGG